MIAHRLIFAALCGAVLGAACPPLCAPNSPTLAEVGVTPDLFALSQRAPETVFNAAAGAFAGGLIGLLQRKNAPAALLILLVNPVALWSFAGGAQSALFLTATLLIAGAAASFAATRDYRALVMLAFALAAAPLVAAPILWAYAPLLLALPFLSPWGLSPPKIAGFLVVLWTPLLMCLLALAFLGLPAAPAELRAGVNWRETLSGDYLTIAAGGAMLALAARPGTFLAAMLGLASGALVMAARFGRIILPAGF